jgi:drug/metabolite transporter (DMT)-like permease
MNEYGRILQALAVFLAVAGIVHGLTSSDTLGAVLMLAAAVCAGYLGLAARRAVAAAAKAESPPPEEPHVLPTIWPFVFALAAVGLILGAVVSPWLLVAGAAMFAVAAMGWFVDVGRQWTARGGHDHGDGGDAHPADARDNGTTDVTDVTDATDATVAIPRDQP